MRRLFNIIKNSSEEDLPVKPQPLDLSYPELELMTKRGFLARKICHYIGLTPEIGDAVFNRSLAGLNPQYSDVNNNQTELILELSHTMLNWDKQHLDIPQQIINLDIKMDLQNAMLKAYEIHKQDVFTSTPQHTEHKHVVSFDEQENNEWEVYRDVIYAATQGQFLLISYEEVNKYTEGTVLLNTEIKNRSDIPVSRNQAKDTLEQKGFSKSKIMSWILVLSEAITNTIKHAEEGKLTIIEDKKNNEIRFVIEDKGPGFALKELPKNTLLAGYSSKKSMGQGFTLMMKMARQVLLFTSSKGSTIILIFDSSKDKVGEIHAIS
ncbi:ATP-binding protein [Bacillus canaveralius]|uniref:ATP-binding protein n=1 Tax=Bacillus canaveralius TaxID=1403243 RepID=UPI0015E0B328|nr:ATP-binding protein [Bacillus canaveralius]